MKDRKPGISAKPAKFIDVGLEHIHEIAGEAQVGPDIYSNHVQISAGLHEFTLDFYTLTPGFGKQQISIKHSQRIILPTSLVKGLISALKEVVDSYEEDTGIALRDLKINPLKPQPPDDPNG